jgi:hypothetical protein
MYILIAIPIFFIILITVVARLEKRMVWPYGKPEPQPQFPDATGYGGRWVEDAIKVGFSFSAGHLTSRGRAIVSVTL